MNGQSIELTLEAAGERIDKALAAVWPDFSRSQWQQLIVEGQVTLKGRPVKASLRLEGGERVIVTMPEMVEARLIAEPIPLDIRYEDDDCILINKPAGMVVHPSTGHEKGTLVNAVLDHCPDIRGVGSEVRPGIVHRLDKDTSGLILVAKNEAALRFLQSQFKARTVEKSYLALVEGRIQPPSALIDAPLARDPNKRKKMSVMPIESGEARAAQTFYTTITTYDDHSLVECSPRTGRTHQIRVHLAYIGHPIVGDKIYGRRKQRLALNRHFLHAARLVFRRPSDGQHLEFRSELPLELQALLDGLV